MPILNSLPRHATRHQDTGSDEISVTNLSGALADRQLSKAGDATLGWTLNKILKGAGAGVAPTEIDVPSLTHVEIVPVSFVPGSADAWVDWDLSASVPASTKYVDIMGHAVNSAQLVVGARKNGTATDRKISAGEIKMTLTFITEVDAGRVIEVYSDDAATKYLCTGYWI